MLPSSPHLPQDTPRRGAGPGKELRPHFHPAHLYKVPRLCPGLWDQIVAEAALSVAYRLAGQRHSHESVAGHGLPPSLSQASVQIHPPSCLPHGPVGREVKTDSRLNVGVGAGGEGSLPTDCGCCGEVILSHRTRRRAGIYRVPGTVLTTLLVSSPAALTASLGAVDNSVLPMRKRKLTPRGEVVCQKIHTASKWLRWGLNPVILGLEPPALATM